MLVDPGLDLGQVLVLLADVVLFGEVDEEDDGFGGEELELVDYFDLEEGWVLVGGFSFEVFVGGKKCGCGGEVSDTKWYLMRVSAFM